MWEMPAGPVTEDEMERAEELKSTGDYS